MLLCSTPIFSSWLDMYFFIQAFYASRTSTQCRRVMSTKVSSDFNGSVIAVSCMPSLDSLGSLWTLEFSSNCSLGSAIKKGNGGGEGKGYAWGEDKGEGKGLTNWLLLADKASGVSLLCCLMLSRLVWGAPFFIKEANRFSTLASEYFWGLPLGKYQEQTHQQTYSLNARFSGLAGKRW